MKFAAYLLLACLVFITSVTALAAPVAAQEHDCCKQMEMAGCKKMPKDNKPRGCEMPGCAMMFTCSICGFMPVQGIALQKVYAGALPEPVAPATIGAITSYQASAWKPPRAC